MDARDFSLRLTVALLLTGVLAGLVGIGFTHLLHAVQQWMFYGGWAAEHISFRELVAQASAGRRLMALLACGVVVGGVLDAVAQIWRAVTGSENGGAAA